MTGRGPGRPARIGQRRCPGPGCAELVSASRLMCRDHWYQVPRPLRDEVWRTWASGAGLLTAEYHAARQAAIDSITPAGGER